MSMTSEQLEAHLNMLLSQKPQVSYDKEVMEWTQVCHYRPTGMDGGEEICRQTQVRKLIQVSGFAQVATTEVVEVEDLVIHEDQLVSLPETALISRMEYQNCGPGASISRTIAMSVQGTKGYSITKTEGVTTSTARTVGVNIATSAGSLNTSLALNTQISTSLSQNESESQAVIRSSTDTISIQPMSMGFYELVAYQTTVDMPFSAVVVVDANLVPNRSGMTKASQLLTREERTFPFKGSIRITGVSDIRVITWPLPGQPVCAGEEPDLTLTTNIEKVPAQNLTGTWKDSAQLLSDLYTTNPKMVGTGHEWSVALNDPPDVMGPADGITYYVQAVTEEVRPYVGCGFNDFGSPNAGIFSVETRAYSDHSKGKLIRTWTERHETFVRCHLI